MWHSPHEAGARVLMLNVSEATAHMGAGGASPHGENTRKGDERFFLCARACTIARKVLSFRFRLG